MCRKVCCVRRISKDRVDRISEPIHLALHSAYFRHQGLEARISIGDHRKHIHDAHGYISGWCRRHNRGRERPPEPEADARHVAALKE
jgi:hypothetical protein